MKKFALMIMVLAFVDATAQVTLESVLTQNAENGEILIVWTCTFRRYGKISWC